MRVVIADDTLLIRDGLASLLRDGGIEVVGQAGTPADLTATLLDGIFAAAFPTKRYRSTWMGIITHTLPSFVIAAVVLSLVLK